LCNIPARIVVPDYLFEVSWDVCSRTGGIYTTLYTKALTCVKEYGPQNYLLIGTDHRDSCLANHDFIEDKNLLKSLKREASNKGIVISIGRWNIPGNPVTILVKYNHCSNIDNIFKDNGTSFESNSTLKEQTLFGLLSGRVIFQSKTMSILPTE
jgi:phosphorylase/glycogen(starch) synthase